MSELGMPLLLDMLIAQDTTGYKLDSWQKRNQYPRLQFKGAFETGAEAGMWVLVECDVAGVEQRAPVNAGDARHVPEAFTSEGPPLDEYGNPVRLPDRG